MRLGYVCCLIKVYLGLKVNRYYGHDLQLGIFPITQKMCQQGQKKTTPRR
jgi:hypothetical protein